MPRCAVLTRFPTKPGDLEACADALSGIHSGLMAGEREWMATEVMIDKDEDAVLLLTHWARDGACHTFETTPGYDAILSRLADYLTDKPHSRTLRIVRERERGSAQETDMAINGGSDG